MGDAISTAAKNILANDNYNYDQKKRGKVPDSDKAKSEKQRWEETFGPNWAEWDEEEYKRKKAQHDAEMKAKYGD